MHFGGVFHTMNASPNMAELLIVLALIPQMRFRIVPVTIGGLIALKLSDNPAIARPAVLLAIVLLATDPATIPRTEIGKLLFGMFVGFGFVLTSVVLRRIGRPDDFSKVMAIPVANVLIPSSIGSGRPSRRTRCGSRSDRRSRKHSPDWGRGRPRSSREAPAAWLAPNMAMVAAWLLLIVPSFGNDKRNAFEPAIHWTWGTPLVQRDDDDVPRCTANPAYCKPFSFLDEASAWLQHGGASIGPEPPLRAALGGD